MVLDKILVIVVVPILGAKKQVIKYCMGLDETEVLQIQFIRNSQDSHLLILLLKGNHINIPPTPMGSPLCAQFTLSQKGKLEGRQKDCSCECVFSPTRFSATTLNESMDSPSFSFFFCL